MLFFLYIEIPFAVIFKQPKLPNNKISAYDKIEAKAYLSRVGIAALPCDAYIQHTFSGKI